MGGILAEKLHWGKNDSKWNTAISSAGVSGLIIGSFAIEPLLRYTGRRKAIMLTALTSMVSVIPTVILQEWCIILGKFFFGLSAGGLIVASSIYLNETVPVKYSTTFGFTTNFGVIIGIMLCLCLGVALPDPSKDAKAAKDDDFWMVISLFPAGIALITMLPWLFCYKYDSLKTYLQSESGSEAREEGVQLVSRVYKCQNEKQG